MLFDVFYEGFFFIPLATLGAQSAQKAPEMEAKWSPKGARGHLLGSVKTMAGTVREAYGEVSGRVREATFSRLRLQTLFGCLLGAIVADFRLFWISFGRLGGPFWVPEGSKNGGNMCVIILS